MIAPPVVETSTIQAPVEAAAPTRRSEQPAGGRSTSGESAADVLRRLGMHAVLEDDAPPAEPQAGSVTTVSNVPPVPPPSAVAQPQAPAEPDHAEGDEQLDAYMAQLMSRLGVKQPPSAGNDAKRAAQPQSDSAAPSSDAPPAPPPASVAPLDPSEFKARSVAAERKSDLTVLRELAKVNARAAIHKHEIRSAADGSRWRSLIALTGIGAASIGGFVWYQGHPLGAMLAGVGAIAAAMFSGRSLGLKQKARSKTRSLDDVLRSEAQIKVDGKGA